MYRTEQPLDPGTIRGVFNEYDVRLTVAELARSIHRIVFEIEQLHIPVGSDGKIGRPEITAWAVY